MKIVILYRPDSEHARASEEFHAEFMRLHPGHKVDLINIDTPAGANLVSVYDAVDKPVILALANDGQLLKMWQGPQLPLMDEVAAYVNQ